MRPWAARPLMSRATRLVAGVDWTAFLGEAWGRRPAVLRRAFAEPLFREGDFFRHLTEARRGLTEGDACQVVLYDRQRVALSGAIASDRSVSPLLEWLPTLADRDFAGYVARLQREPRFERFGLFLNRPHQDPLFWLPVREVLTALLRHVELPAASLNTDAFIGNYQRTTFGAHRDRLDNLLFMVTGRRTMRLWSHEAFCAAMGDCDADQTFQDYSRALPNAETFTLEAGDLLYWPADYWHVGEGDDKPSISFNLDFPIPDGGDCMPIVVERAVDQLVQAAAVPESVPQRAAFCAVPGAIPEVLLRIERSVERVRAALGSADFEHAVSEQYLRWLTAGGFNHVPAPLAPAPVDARAFVQIEPRHPIRTVAIGDLLVAAACGHAVRAPACEALAQLIDELNQGLPLQVADLYQRYVGRQSRSPAGMITLTEDAIRFVLAALVSFRGLFVVDIAGFDDAPGPLPIDNWREMTQGELHAVDLAEAAAQLERYGVTWLADALPVDQCDLLREYLVEQRRIAPAELLGNIHASRRRFDLPLTLDAVVGPAVRAAGRRLAGLIERMTGAGAAVVELSSLTSLPGAKAQVEHPDAQFGDAATARLYTLFFSLDDISDDMGPLAVWPATHRSRFFDHEELKHEVLAPEREVRLCLRKGAVAIMDARTWHRGTANRSDRPRPVLYLSVLGEGEPPRGPTYTLMPDFKDRLRFADLIADAMPLAAGTPPDPSTRG